MKKAIVIVLLVVFTAMLGVSGYFIWDYYQEAGAASSQFDDLAKIAEEARNNGTGRADTPSGTGTPSQNVPGGENTGEDPEGDTSAGIDVDYSALYDQNNDMVGWIRIPDTRIDYPVMQTKDRPNYYLHRGFDKGYSSYGCPYVQENCDVERPSDNLVIYGHHMDNGTMFADLEKFRKVEFWENHRTFTFDLIHEHREYEILAVFTTVAIKSSDTFEYFAMVNARNEEEFDKFVATCKKRAMYDTGVNASYGDKLVCLSTCEYTQKAGRLVVVGRWIQPEPAEPAGDKV